MIPDDATPKHSFANRKIDKRALRDEMLREGAAGRGSD